MRHPFSRSAVVIAVVASVAAAPSADQVPVFRSRIDLVTVDAAVLDPNGRPVESLTASDFALKVDGALRPVLSAEYVSHRRTADATAAADSPAVSNDHAAAGRLILVAVDQGNIRQTEGRVALRAASAFIDSLGADDRVAAVAIDDVRAISFTGDRHVVKRALTRLTGRAAEPATEINLGIAEALAIAEGNRSRLDQVVLRECGEPLSRLQDLSRLARTNGLRNPCPTHVEQQARMVAHSARSQGAQSIDALARLLRRLADLEGPKTVVLLSEGMIAEPRTDLTEVAALAQKARVTIYVLQLDSPVADAATRALSPTLADDLRVRADGLARVAGAGGGAVFQLVGTDGWPFARILEETSGYYLLTFETRPEDRDGRTHHIQLSVTAPRVTVRARPAFRAPPPSTVPLSTEDRLVQLLRAPRLAAELPLRLSAVNARAADGLRIHTLVTLEAGAGEDDVTYGSVIIDGQGIVVMSGTGRSTTGRYVFPAVLPAGNYRLKAAAITSTGRAGTVEHALAAVVHGGGGGTQWSDLVLAAPQGGRRTDQDLIVDRTRGPRLSASFELYAAALPTPTVHLQLTGTGGVTREAEVRPTAAATGVWVVRTDFDVSALPPGRYVVQARWLEGTTLTRSLVVLK